MIRLDLELDPQLVEFSWELIREALVDLKQDPDDRFAPTDPDDEDLAEAWTDSLREELDVDFQSLTTLFTDNRFGEETIELKPEAAEGILRACSSIRLWLRTRRLKDVTDETLEGGIVNLETMEPEPRLAYFTYGLLAYLQETLIGLLDGA